MPDDLAGQTPRTPGSSTGNPATPHVGSHPAERGGEHGLRTGAGEPRTPPPTTRPPHATRYLDTTLGVLSYEQLAPLLAEKAGDLEAAIVLGEFSARAPDEELLRDFHARLCSAFVPDWAGVWRQVAVTVGPHEPPPPHEVPLVMRNYALDLAARWKDAHASSDERLLDLLAFAEGRLLSIHPFRDFNGRVCRLFLREILRRLELPGISLVPFEPAARDRYLHALGAGDRQDYRPLIEIWRERIESTRLE